MPDMNLCPPTTKSWLCQC